MRLTNHSSVPVYTISGSSTARPLPEWLARKRKRSLKNDPEYASRIELLQDFEFEEASQCIRVSEDGQWVMSTGTYKPQIHTHYLPHLSLSYARHTISLNTTFLLLSTDYSKSMHLQADRSIEFHTPSGCHYTTRIPRYGRDLKYDRWSTEALVPAVGVNEHGNGEVFRLNLELGRYMHAYEVDVGDNAPQSSNAALQGAVDVGGVNTAAVAEESHNLLAFGTSIGTVEFWDPRSRSRAGILRIPGESGPPDTKVEVTALEFHRSGLNLAAGSSNGLIHLYDLRSPIPVLRKDQGYGYPIQTLIYLTPSTSSANQTSEPKVLSADKRIIKIWEERDGSPWTSVEPAVDINSVAWCKDSGMLLTANEGRQQHSFFIPQLGPAPRWCSFLDNLVEEMAEDPNDPNAFKGQRAGEVYDNYKFLTTEQLVTLNLSHLVGTTNLLRPYMHGYFVAQRLYEEARLIADPFMWDEQLAKRVKEKINSERESRIRGTKKIKMKVNQRLAEKLQEKEDKNERRKAKRALDKGAELAKEAEPDSEESEGQESKPARNNLIADPRFAKLFQDDDFAIDETSREFQMINPSTTVNARGGKEKRLTAAEEEAIASNAGSSSDNSSEEEAVKPKAADSGRISSASYKKRDRGPRQPPQMQVTSSNKPRVNHDLSFGSRAVRTRKPEETSKTVVGEREITFAPQRKSKTPSKHVGWSSSDRKRDKERRSASGNVFRRM
ncbi:MAG: hypothetical protein MMC33_007384 [Icmadophila ericetorum]|nr:hypothetical protein [Icmadophila ericetorum]